MNNGIYFNFLESAYEGIFVSTNLDYTKCYTYQGVPVQYFDDSRFAQTYIALAEALNSLDLGIVASFVVRNRKEYRRPLEKHLDGMKELTDFDRTRKAVLSSVYADTRAIEQFVFFTHKKYPNTLINKQNRLLFNFDKWNPLKRPVLKYTVEEHVSRKAILEKNAKLFFETLGSVGCKSKEMSLKDVGAYCYYHLNHCDSQGEVKNQTYYHLKNGDVVKVQKTIREQVLESEIELNLKDNKGNSVLNCIRIGERYLTVMVVNVLGTFADTLFYQKLCKYLPDDHEFMVTAERIENQELYDLFKKNKGNINILGSAKDVLNRDMTENVYALHSNQAILKDGQIYIKDVEELNLRSFKFSIQFTLKSESLGELQDYISILKKMLNQQEFNDTRVVINPDLVVNNYHSFLPGNSHQIFDWVYNNTISMMYNVPIHEEWKGYDTFSDTSPTNQIYMNRKNELVKYHTFHFDSNFKHHESTASTGSGKTFDFNKQIDGILSEKTDDSMKSVVIAIEPKRGFLKICRFYEGEVITYKQTAQKSFNPFFKKQDVYSINEMDYEGYDVDVQKYDALILNYYLNLLEHLASEENKNFLAPRMKGILLNIITELYDQNDENFIPILSDIVSKLRDYSSDDEETRSEIVRVRDNLDFYCRDMYKNLFQIRAELNIQNDFLYFDLGALEDDLQMKNTVMYIMASSIMRKLRLRNCIKYLFIDEASVFHQSEIGAKMIEFFLRLSRSLGGVINLGSQNVSDSIDSKASKTIKNALAVETCMWLKDGHKYLTEIGYTEEEKQSIENLCKKPGHYIELFRKIAGKPMILRSPSNPYLYWLSTNDPMDDELFLSYQEQNKECAFSELISKLAKDYPNGHIKK